MDQWTGDVWEPVELSTKLFKRRCGCNEASTLDGDPLSLVSSSVGAQPCVISGPVRISPVNQPHPSRSENLAELWMDRNFRPNGREQILGVQDSSLHQERSKLLLHDLGRLLAR